MTLRDVTKGGYLGKECYPVSLGTWKKCDVLLNHHYVLFPLFDKWRIRERKRMTKMASGKRSFIPILDTWKELKESSAFFYWASLSELDLEFVSFLPLEMGSSTSVISSMVEIIPWSGNEKTRYRCTPIHFMKLKWFPMNYSISQHDFEIFLKKSSKTTHELFWPLIFFHHICGHYSSAFWAWNVALIWSSSQSTLVLSCLDDLHMSETSKQKYV